MKFLHHQFLSAEGLPADAARSLVDMAAALRLAAGRGADQPLLKGKNIALLCVDTSNATASAFEEAATRLGARVSRLQPDPALLDGDGGSARMLARLYDAIECNGLPRQDALRLQRLVGVPVYNGLARPDHPLAALLSRLPAPAGADDLRCLVQAALVQTMA